MNQAQKKYLENELSKLYCEKERATWRQNVLPVSPKERAAKKLLVNMERKRSKISEQKRVKLRDAKRVVYEAILFSELDVAQKKLAQFRKFQV